MDTPSQQSENRFSHEFWIRFRQSLLNLNAGLSVKQVATTIANDCVSLVGCDRVTVVRRYGRRYAVAAISGQETVHRRATVVRLLEQLSQKVAADRRPLTYCGKGSDEIPVSLQKPLSEYLASSKLRYLHILPMQLPTDEIEPNEEDCAPAGCIIIERADSGGRKPNVERRLRLIGPHAASAMTNADLHESLFLQPVWKTLGKVVRWFRGRRLRIAAGILVATLAAVVTAVVVQVPYRVRVDGVIMPRERHSIFAPVDGEVRKIHVQDGTRVAAGDALISLESSELKTQLVILQHEIEETEKLVRSLRGRLDTNGSQVQRHESILAETEFVSEKLSLETAQKRLELLNRRLADLDVLAPAAGVVVTFDLGRRLQNRPVNRGELLVEVMNDNGPWELELTVPDYRMGHVGAALKAVEAQTTTVSFVTANDVETTLQGRITAVGTRTDVSPEDGVFVKVRVSMESAALSEKLIGAEASARITCGECSLLYAVFGDAWEFVLRHWW